ncbi:MAG: hypothetical protein LBG21_02030 [Campylobacteraceae bacterium]|jgi:hypothetical protein|nr:hypothetical protein [Campylobacteraceae bacterium]
MEFLSSHLNTQKRIEYILKTQENSTKIKLTPLNRAIFNIKTMTEKDWIASSVTAFAMTKQESVRNICYITVLLL